MLSTVAKTTKNLVFKQKRFMYNGLNNKPKSLPIKRWHVTLGLSLMVAGPVVHLIISTYDAHYERKQKEELLRREELLLQIEQQQKAELTKPKINLEYLKILIAAAIKGDSVEFDMGQVRWIAENDPETLPLVKNLWSDTTYMDIKPVQNIADANRLLEKLVNLESVKTDFAGTKLNYPPSLKRFSATLTKDECQKLNFAETNLSQLKLESLRLNCKDSNSKIILNPDTIPKTLKIITILSSTAKISKNPDPIDNNFYVDDDFIELKEFPNLEIFDVRNQSVYFSECSPNLKYVRCVDFKPKQTDSVDDFHVRFSKLEHFEARGSIDETVCKNLIKANKHLRHFKTRFCAFDEEMLKSLPEYIVSLSAYSLTKKGISLIPDNCQHLSIGRIIRDPQCETEVETIKWPDNLHSLKIWTSNVDPSIYKSLPISTSTLSIPMDRALTDYHLTVEKVIPAQITYLDIRRNQLVTAAGLRNIVNRGCRVIIDLDWNKKEVDRVAGQLRETFKKFSEEKL
jgi:hypothetical protein